MKVVQMERMFNSTYTRHGTSQHTELKFYIWLDIYDDRMGPFFFNEAIGYDLETSCHCRHMNLYMVVPYYCRLFLPWDILSGIMHA